MTRLKAPTPPRPRVKLLRAVTWRDWLLPALFFAAVFGLWWQWAQLTGQQRWVGGGFLAVAVGLLVPRLWRGLFGPVLFYDLMRTARRGRYILLRVVFAVVLLLVLWAVYLQFADRLSGYRTGRFMAGGLAFAMAEDPRTARAAELARFAEVFFSTFIGVQLAAVLLLTPAYTAGCIADEKDRKTLEFLFATDLANREIVLSKLVACMANVAMLVLTGLPILSFMQLLGGVDPNLVLAGYAVTLLTIVSLASVSVLVSVYSQKARDAIVLSYLCVLAYVMLSFFLALPIPVLRRPPTSAEELFWADLLEQLAGGNAVIMLGQLKEAWDMGTPVTSILPGLLRRYALFHGLLAVVSTTWAVQRLRAVGLRAHRPRLKKERTARHWLRPHIGRQPMLWKEIHAERGMAFNWFGKAIVAVIILVSFVPPAWMGLAMLFEENNPAFGTAQAFSWDRVARAINGWVRVVGTTVACLTLLGVAIRAAGSVSGERDRQTLDNLLTTPLRVRQILFAKWLGSIVSVRWAWAWLSLVWALGVLLGGLDLATLPWLLVLWSVYAAFFAILGQRFSITRSTTLRATLITLAVLAGLSLAHWLPRLFWAFQPRPYSYQPTLWDLVLNFQEFGLTPPVALSWFAFHGNNVTSDTFGLGTEDWNNPMAVFLSIVSGLVLWGLGAAWLWRGNQILFAAQSGRTADALPAVPVQVSTGWGP